MKRLALTLGVLAISGTAAFSQDTGNISSNWTGLYAGGSISAGDGALNATDSFRSDLSAGGIGKSLSNMNGAGGSLRAGYDVQVSKFIIGAGGDYNLGKIDGQWKPAPATFLGNPSMKSTASETASLFARAGYDAGEWMPYAMAGYTWSDGKLEAGDTTERFTLEGATVGLGVEHNILNNLSAYGEWNYTSYKDIDKGIPDAAELNSNQFKMGLNFRF